MKGFKQYTSEMLRLAREVTESPELRARRKELEEAFSNDLFGLPGPTSVTRDLSPYEILFRDLFYGFVEISNSYVIGFATSTSTSLTSHSRRHE